MVVKLMRSFLFQSINLLNLEVVGVEVLYRERDMDLKYLKVDDRGEAFLRPNWQFHLFFLDVWMFMFER